MFRWKRAFSTQLVILTTILLISGCSDLRWNWMSKNVEIDLQTVADPIAYQQNYIECNAFSRARRNGHSTIATSTGGGTITGAAGAYILPTAGVDLVTNVGVGAASGGLSSFIWNSWVTNHKINRDTAICLVNRGYNVLDKDWWIRMQENGYHGY